MINKGNNYNVTICSENCANRMCESQWGENRDDSRNESLRQNQLNAYTRAFQITTPSPESLREAQVQRFNAANINLVVLDMFCA